MIATDRSEHPVCESLRAHDYESVREFVSSMFDLELSDDAAEMICALWGGRHCDWHVSAGPAIWIKNRLYNLGTFRTPGIQPDDEDHRFVANALHVFFLQLEETSEMIASLKVGETPSTSEIARSIVFDSKFYIKPIDSTAYKVWNNKVTKEKK